MHQGLQLPVALRFCLTSYGKGLKEAKKGLKFMWNLSKQWQKAWLGFRGLSLPLFDLGNMLQPL